jgi:hypothetical protein
MKLGKFIASLLPSFEKKQIKEDLKVTRDELDESLPPLNAAKDFFANYSFKSDAAEALQKRFVKETGDNKTPNFVVASVRMVEAIDGNLSTLEKLVDRYFSDDVLKEGLTYVKANLLQYIQHLTFSIRFARHLVLWTYQVEANKVDKSSDIQMTRGELKWLEDNISNFFTIYPFMLVSKENLERTISSIPDAVITEDNINTLSSTVGMQKLDPFGQNFVGVRFNPIYHVRIAVAEWQADRYKLAVEERATLEFRLLHLKMLNEGNYDAKTEKLLHYNEMRLEKVKARILKAEEDAND